MTKLIDRRGDFPALTQKVHGHDLNYLDSAASTLKPQVVVDALTRHYSMETANVHRGIHFLSAQGTMKYEQTRQTLKEFVNAKEECEIIFTKGTTDSVNLVAASWSQVFLKEGDQILISTMEHHSNFVPWQMAAEKQGAHVIEIPINHKGDIDLDAFKKLLNPKVKMVTLSAISNTLGTVNPIEEMTKLAHEAGAHVLIDAAQSIAHAPTDVQKIDCDFMVFSAHKMFGPTGVGVLYGKKDLLEQMPPYQGGGAMIKEVGFDGTTYNELPEKFEAGTPHIAGVIAFKTALDYISELGLENIWQHEQELLRYATERLAQIEGLTIIGQADHKAGVISFTLEGAHPHDLGMILDEQGIAIRTGHHCTQPLMHHYGVTATARASFAVYNNYEDVDRLVAGILKAKELL